MNRLDFGKRRLVAGFGDAQPSAAPRCPPRRSVPVEDRRLFPGRMHGALIRGRGRATQARHRPNLPRRGHPRRDQGAAAVGRVLCRRLPGCAGVAHDGRAQRRARHHGRAGHPHRDQRVRSRGGGDAGRLDQLSGPRRGDLEIDRRHQCRLGRAVQPRFGGRQGRRAHRHRRGLRRGLFDHPGALPRLCDEVADLAAGPAPQPSDHRAHGRAGFRAVRGIQHAGIPRVAHPRLPRARQLRSQGQPARARLAQARAGTLRFRLRPHLPAAGDLRAGKAQNRGALAGRGELHPRPSSERIFRRAIRRRRHHLPGRSVQRDHSRAAAARAVGLLRRDQDSHLLPQRHLSAGSRRSCRVLRRQARAAHRRGRAARLHRGCGARPAAARGSRRRQGLRQGPAAPCRGIHQRGGAERRRAFHRDFRARAAWTRPTSRRCRSASPQ